MNYLEWNDAIAAHFFRPDMADRRVFLAVTVDDLKNIGKENGVGKEDFLRAVRKGPPWTHSEYDICRKATLTNMRWRERNLLYPPYVGFLAVFVLAAAGTDGFKGNAYYGPLSDLLDQKVGVNQFEPMDKLWLDLRRWAHQDKGDALGVFRAGIPVGSAFVNVGLPRSQTLLMSSERAALPRFFADNNLDPTSLPTETALLRALRNAPFLRTSTRQLLGKIDVSSGELQSSLAGFILDELQAWDGTVEELEGNISRGTSSIRTVATLRLCLKFNLLAKRADATVRFKTNHSFPDRTLNLKDTFSGLVWLGQESQDGWSRSLSSEDEDSRRVILNASTLNWTCGQNFRDTELGWRIALAPATVRLFLPGGREGLPDDWVEATHLVPGCSFCVACCADQRNAIEAWGNTSCEAFEEMAFSGLPTGWILFRAKNASKSHSDLDLLKFSTRRRLLLVGGIKAESRHSFFHFNPPAFMLDGGDGTETISCSESLLTGDEDGLWRFSNKAPLHTALHVICAAETLTLTLLPTELCLKYDVPALDQWGVLTKGDGLVRGIEAPEDGLVPPTLDIPTHYGGHIVFLGRRAGEVSDWPGDPLPDRWQPVWAIVKVHRDEWQAHFIGTASSMSAIRQSRQGNWGDWCRMHLRRRTEAVGIKSVRDFWARCCKEANQL